MWSSCSSGKSAGFEHPPSYLVKFHGFEQGLEIPLAEALVALALDELEKNRAELVFAEDLQQQFTGLAVDEDIAVLERGDALAQARDSPGKQLVVGRAGV